MSIEDDAELLDRMARRSSPPKEPHNPWDAGQPFWVMTHPTGMLWIAGFLVAMGIVMLWAPFTIKDAEPAAYWALGGMGLFFFAAAGYEVHLSRLRARWYRELDAWYATHPEQERPKKHVKSWT